MLVLVFGLHYIAFAVALGCLFLQIFNLRDRSGTLRVAVLTRIDALYGIAALLSIGSGLLRVFVYGKGPGFYAVNPVFWTKMAVFALIGLLSVFPTLQFLKNRDLTLRDWRANRPAMVSRIYRILQVEIMLYLVLPFLAVGIAHF